MNELDSFSDQNLWSWFKQQKKHPAYQAYAKLMTTARVVSGGTLGFLALGLLLFGWSQMGIGLVFLISSWLLSAGFGTWLLYQKPGRVPMVQSRPTPNQWRIITLCYFLGVSTLIGLTVLTMVYRDQLILAIRQGRIGLVQNTANQGSD